MRSPLPRIPNSAFCPPTGTIAENAAPWGGQWCYIYDVIVLSQPWYDRLFFEDLFVRTFAKFSVNCQKYNKFSVNYRLSNQSRRHGGAFGDLAPNKTPSPPNWNMKHYKSVECSSIFRMSSPTHKPKSPPQKRKAPLLKTFWRRFCAEYRAAGPNAQLQLAIATTWWYPQSIRTSNNYYKQKTLSWTVRQQQIKKHKHKNNDFVAFTQQLVFSNIHKTCSGQELEWPKLPFLNSQDD